MFCTISELILPFYNKNDRKHVEIIGATQEVNRIARSHGFINTGNVLQNYYSFISPSLRKRSLRRAAHLHNTLIKDPRIGWVEQQVSRRMVLRNEITFDDVYWKDMWYSNPTLGDFHMNVVEAWRQNYTGDGIVVSVLDNGLQWKNADIELNYDSNASYDFQNERPDPSPRISSTSDTNTHGTNCAGLIAAFANNKICSVGIAYGAKVGGVKIFDEEKTDIIEARALSFNRQHIDIYSNSWGPDDNDMSVEGPRKLASIALKEGVEQGRQGRGSIFVWATGNGGESLDDCNCDGYSNSIYTIGITGAAKSGEMPTVNEACSAALAAASTRYNKTERVVYTTDPYNDGCTDGFGGTSASTAFAAGIFALTLQANPKLTWRDLQHIIVRTANSTGLKAKDWRQNGAGRRSSHYFGFGLLNAGAMVNLALKWSTVPPLKKCSIQSFVGVSGFTMEIPNKQSKTSTVNTSSCSLDFKTNVKFVESVQAVVTLTLSASSKRGDIQIFLTSPRGTESRLLSSRTNDFSKLGFNEWPFMTVHNWGEEAVGDWILKFVNDSPGTITLVKWTLNVYGTTNNVSDTGGEKSTSQSNMNGLNTSNCCSWSRRNFCSGCVNNYFLYKNSCVQECPPSRHYVYETSDSEICGRSSCRLCPPFCETCSGLEGNTCLTCTSDYKLDAVKKCVKNM